MCIGDPFGDVPRADERVGRELTAADHLSCAVPTVPCALLKGRSTPSGRWASSALQMEDGLGDAAPPSPLARGIQTQASCCVLGDWPWGALCVPPEAVSQVAAGG